MVRRTKEDAVSPVIGIMLMLVVTIIIAGTVTLFATGILGDTDNMGDTSITKVKFVGFETAGNELLYVENPSFTARAETGLVFEVVSGDAIDMRNLKLIIDDHNLRGSNSAGRLEFTFNDFPVQGWNKDYPGSVTLPEKYFEEWTTNKWDKVSSLGRFISYPPVSTTSTEAAESTVVEPGDRFMFLTEYAGFTNWDTYKWESGWFGIRSDYHGSGAYTMSSSSTEITLVDTTTGSVLMNCHLTDGVLI